MNHRIVIEHAPVLIGLGSWIILLSFYCEPKWSAGLSLLGAVVCSMALGGLIVSYPDERSDQGP